MPPPPRALPAAFSASQFSLMSEVYSALPMFSSSSPVKGRRRMMFEAAVCLRGLVRTSGSRSSSDESSSSSCASDVALPESNTPDPNFALPESNIPDPNFLRLSFDLLCALVLGEFWPAMLRGEPPAVPVPRLAEDLVADGTVGRREFLRHRSGDDGDGGVGRSGSFGVSGSGSSSRAACCSYSLSLAASPAVRFLRHERLLRS
mmetsp:Transcript_74996/g.193555  ORF Transcript_74996/g.193555 Transcript_74996/m.193555 type:complete len:204 (+) Transcript_74996:175-786(+)